MTVALQRFVSRCVVLVGGLALLVYWPILLGKVPLPAELVTQFPPWESVHAPRNQPPHAEMGDLVTELYPWKAYTRRAISAGALPLWNPFLLLGAPFVGDPQTALFYPPHLLYAFLPTPLAWSLSFLVRTILAGLLAALLARRLGASQVAAFMAGVIFGFCGWTTAFQARPHLDTCLWLPLALLAVDHLQRRPSGRSVALAAAAFALPVLAGQPESAAHVTLVGLLFFAYRFALPPPHLDASSAGRSRYALLFAGAGVLALALAAVQILPTLEFIGQLDRSLQASWGAKPPREIAAFLSRDLGAHPNSAGVEIPECAAYAGMLTLLLAPLAILHRNRRDAVFLAILVACVLQVVYGFGPAYWLSSHTPVLRGIPNWRLLAVADLGLALLAALGLNALETGADSLRWPRARWLLPGAAFAVAIIGVALILARGRIGFVPHPFVSMRTIRGPASSAAILLTASALLATNLAGRLRPARFAALALAFCALDLASASYRYIPFVRPAEIFPPAPTFRFDAADPELHRIASVDAAYGAGFELVYGLDSATGFNVVVHRTEELLAPLGFEGTAPRLTSEAILASRGRLLDLMNVKYLVATTWNRGAERLAAHPERFRRVFSDASVRVFQNLSALPRAFLVPAAGAVVLPDDREQLARVRAEDFDPASSVVVGEAPSLQIDASVGETPVAPVVDGFTSASNEIRMRVGAAEPSVLVLSQTWYPGWKALVDGKPQPILRVDYGLTGTLIGPGSHTVLFVYAPASLQRGTALTAAALLICFGLATLGGRRSMTWWRRKRKLRSDPAGETPVPSPQAMAPPPLPTPIELYDTLLARLGFDSVHPGWFPALRDLHRHSRSKRLQVFPDFFYAPVFAPADLAPAVWEGTFPDCGVFDLDAQRTFLSETPSFARELSSLPYDAPPSDSTAFYWGNDQFSHSDASLYYSLIRRFRPQRIVEVGAGHSTKLAARAIRENGTGRILCIDPHAPKWLSDLEGRVEVVAKPVQQTPDSVFLELAPSDILFIDGSHISKTGSDVNHLFLRILPRIPKGVIVHVHDICLPYEYPKTWSEDVLCYWNEQYVLAALLANSAKYEILLGVYFLQRRDLEALRPFVPSVKGVFPGGGSIWLRARD